jgi:transporter family-2 protein
LNQQSWFFPLAVLIGLLAGCLLGAQPSANGFLGRFVGHPLHASTISFASGTALLVIVLILMGQFPPRLTVSPFSLPWWTWIGGAIGTVLVTASLYFVPKIGSLAWFAAVITGQVFASLILDQMGWMGNPRQPANGLRIAGALLLIVGILCIVKSRSGDTLVPLTKDAQGYSTSSDLLESKSDVESERLSE